MVQPVTLMDDRLDALRQGEAVRVAIPELGGEVVMILAAPGETTEQVLEETLQDIREKQAWADLGSKSGPTNSAFLNEVKRRDQELSSGSIQGHPHENVLAAARKSLQSE